jgi:hypothetical protein
MKKEKKGKGRGEERKGKEREKERIKRGKERPSLPNSKSVDLLRFLKREKERKKGYSRAKPVVVQNTPFGAEKAW